MCRILIQHSIVCWLQDWWHRYWRSKQCKMCMVHFLTFLAHWLPRHISCPSWVFLWHYLCCNLISLLFVHLLYLISSLNLPLWPLDYSPICFPLQIPGELPLCWQQTLVRPFQNLHNLTFTNQVLACDFDFLLMRSSNENLRSRAHCPSYFLLNFSFPKGLWPLVFSISKVFLFIRMLLSSDQLLQLRDSSLL